MVKFKLAIILILGALTTTAQQKFEKVTSYDSKAHFQNHNHNPVIVDIDKSKNLVDVYYSDYLDRTLQLHVPSGYTIDTIFSADQRFTSSARLKYAYQASNSSGNTIGLISDYTGQLQHSYPDATDIKIFGDITAWRLMVKREVNGKSYFDIYDIGWSNPAKTFEAERLYTNVSKRSGYDTSHFIYYYVDVKSEKLMVYGHNFQLKSSVSLSIPSGYTLSPNTTLFYSDFFNESSEWEIGTTFSNGASYGARVFQSNGKLLQHFDDVTELMFYSKYGNSTEDAVLFTKIGTNNLGNWKGYVLDKKLSGSNAQYKVTLPGKPVSQAGSEVYYYKPDSQLIRCLYMDSKPHVIWNKDIKLNVSSNEEMVRWSLYFNGDGDNDPSNQEIFYQVKNKNTLEQRFQILRDDNTSLLNINGVLKYQNQWEFQSWGITRVGVWMKNGGLDIYAFDWSVDRVERITPAYNDQNVPYKNTLFNWKGQKHASEYRIRVFKDKGSGNAIHEELTKDTFVIVPFLDSSTTYYWTMDAYNGRFSRWNDSLFIFRTADPLKVGKPILKNPAYNSKDLDKDAITLSWLVEDLAKTYEYEISEDLNFATATKGTVTDTFVKISGLNFDKTYYWHVKAINGQDESEWSETWLFATSEESTLNAPELVSPVDKKEGEDVKPTFTWKPVVNAQEYTIEYADNSGFVDATSQKVTTNSFLVATALEGETEYFWRVKASGLSGSSPWSTAWSFTTIGAGKLAIPTLLSPANNAENIDASSVVLEWTAVTGATSYSYQVSTDVNFGSYIAGEPTTTSATPIGLVKNETYYWRVRATDGSSLSDWSDISVFKTGDVDNVNGPAILEFSMYPNPVTEVLFIESFETTPLKYRLVSTSGRLVLEGNLINGQENALNLAQLSAGYYQLYVQGQSGTVVRKVLVKP